MTIKKLQWIESAIFCWMDYSIDAQKNILVEFGIVYRPSLHWTLISVLFTLVPKKLLTANEY